jgi:hypothetical protein
LYAFDHLIVVGSTRLNEIDLKIAAEARKNKVPVSFIRTKLDQDVHNTLRTRNKKSASQLAEEIRSAILHSLKESGFGDCTSCVYIVSASGFMGQSDKVDEDVFIRRILASTLLARSKYYSSHSP